MPTDRPCRSADEHDAGGNTPEDAEAVAREITGACDRSGSLPALMPLYEGEGFRLFADGRNARALHDDVGGARTVREYLAAHLSIVEPGDCVALVAYLPMSLERERLLAEMRVLIHDHLRVATCVDFGARSQHSSEQVYKCEPSSGVLIEITCGDIADEAQARSDFDALAQRGRRALRIDVGDDATAGLIALRDAIEQVLHYTSQDRAEKWR